MSKIKFNTYTDESGQDTKGKKFIVCTVIIHSNKIEEIEKKLLESENESGKNKKWYESGDKRRHKYIGILLKKKIFSSSTIYYSEYQNKLDYTSLVSSHITKSILSFSNSEDYISKIFIDKVDKKTIGYLTKEIKRSHIRFKKIRGLTEESNVYIRLADALCGLIRDMNNKNIPNDYKVVFSKIKKI